MTALLREARQCDAENVWILIALPYVLRCPTERTWSRLILHRSLQWYTFSCSDTRFPSLGVSLSIFHDTERETDLYIVWKSTMWKITKSRTRPKRLWRSVLASFGAARYLGMTHLPLREDFVCTNYKLAVLGRHVLGPTCWLHALGQSKITTTYIRAHHLSRPQFLHRCNARCLSTELTMADTVRSTQRAPRACLQCTKRKVKCDKALPCKPCRMRGITGECKVEPVRVKGLLQWWVKRQYQFAQARHNLGEIDTRLAVGRTFPRWVTTNC